jgi:hypothetical protein
MNGILAGLVSITAPCAVVEPYGAIIIGILGATFYKFASIMLLRLRIDDPVDAFPVHGICGVWGLIAGGFFATEAYVHQTYGRDPAVDDWGVFYGGSGRQLAAQLIAIPVVGLWSMFWSCLFFGTYRLIDSKRLNPLFIFKDETTFEVLTFGLTKGGLVDASSDFVDPLAFQMQSLPDKTKTEKGASPWNAEDSSSSSEAEEVDTSKRDRANSGQKDIPKDSAPDSKRDKEDSRNNSRKEKDNSTGSKTGGDKVSNSGRRLERKQTETLPGYSGSESSEDV